jgi:hypothetical protein
MISEKEVDREEWPAHQQQRRQHRGNDKLNRIEPPEKLRYPIEQTPHTTPNRTR